MGVINCAKYTVVNQGFLTPYRDLKCDRKISWAIAKSFNFEQDQENTFKYDNTSRMYISRYMSKHSCLG